MGCIVISCGMHSYQLWGAYLLAVGCILISCGVHNLSQSHEYLLEQRFIVAMQDCFTGPLISRDKTIGEFFPTVFTSGHLLHLFCSILRPG